MPHKSYYGLILRITNNTCTQIRVAGRNDKKSEKSCGFSLQSPVKWDKIAPVDAESRIGPPVLGTRSSFFSGSRRDGKVVTLADNRAALPMRSPTFSRRGGGGSCTNPLKIVSQIAIAAFVAAVLTASAGFLAHEIAHRNHPVLGWLTLFPLLAVMRIFPAKSAMLGGAFWGAGLFFFLAQQAQPLIPPTLASFAFLVGLPAAYAFGMGCVARRFGFHPLILAFGWCGVELALLPLGLPGGLLGGIVGESGGLLSVMQGLLGYVCMAALVVAVNAVALAMLTRAYARVCASQRLVRSSSAGPQSRIIPREIPICWHSYGLASQPRAPPLPA